MFVTQQCLFFDCKGSTPLALAIEDRLTNLGYTNKQDLDFTGYTSICADLHDKVLYYASNIEYCRTNNDYFIEGGLDVLFGTEKYSAQNMKTAPEKIGSYPIVVNDVGVIIGKIGNKLFLAKEEVKELAEIFN
jgi:hypothetical protein